MHARRVTAPAAAKLLGVSRPTICAYVNRGKLPAVRMGKQRTILIRVEDLQRFATENGIKIKEDL